MPKLHSGTMHHHICRKQRKRSSKNQSIKSLVYRSLLPHLFLPYPSSLHLDPYTPLHDRTRNRDTATLVPITLDTLCLPCSATFAFDDTADCGGCC